MRKLHSTLQLPALVLEGGGWWGGRKVGHQLWIGRRVSSEDFFHVETGEKCMFRRKLHADCTLCCFPVQILNVQSRRDAAGISTLARDAGEMTL